MKKTLSLLLLWVLVTAAPLVLGALPYLLGALLVRPSTPLERLLLLAGAVVCTIWTARLLLDYVVKQTVATSVRKTTEHVVSGGMEKVTEAVLQKLSQAAGRGKFDA